MSELMFCIPYPTKLQEYKMFQQLIREIPTSYTIHRIKISENAKSQPGDPWHDVFLSFSLHTESGTYIGNDILFNNGIEGFNLAFNDELIGSLKEGLLNEIDEKVCNDQTPNITYQAKK